MKRLDNKLDHKVAVITGAARGIGRAVAVAFAHEGAVVVGVDSAGPVSGTTAYAPATPADLEETGRLVREAGGRFLGIQADIRDMAALRGVAGRVRDELGGLDILFANAGIQAFAPLLEMTDEGWNDTIDINLTGTANTVRAFAPLMVERGGGRIIVTASGQGKKGLRHGSSYAASKWGTIGFVKSAAMDLGGHGITVNALIPGLILTDMTRNETRLTEAYHDYAPSSQKPEGEEEVARVRAEHSPLGLPWLPPEDMAPMVVFLASDGARHITGATFAVDAGASSSFTG